MRQLDRVMGINLDGVINSTRAFLPHMKDHPEAAIVNTRPYLAWWPYPGRPCTTTKFAVRGFTESLALEMKETNPIYRFTVCTQATSAPILSPRQG